MRLYDLLVRAYPSRFRAQFETGLRHAFAQDLAAARSRGIRALATFWLVTMAQAIWYGLAERRRGADVPSAYGGPRPSAFAVDWRDAWRSLVATPGVTAVAVVSLALGIGANTAIFSIVDSLLLKSLPVREPERLALVDGGEWTNPIWEQIRDRQDRLFDGAFAWSGARFNLSEQATTDLVGGAYVSGRFFDILGVRPALGRMLTVQDDARHGGPDGAVAVVSFRFWQERLGADPAAVGRRLVVEHVPFTLVGVIPPGFAGPEVGREYDIFLPLGNQALVNGSEATLDGRLTWWLSIMARLKRGQSAEEATGALRGVQPQIRAATLPPGPQPPDAHYLQEGLTLLSAATGQSTLRNRYQHPLGVITVVVGMVLLIACANIANLLLARATARRHELSLRLALGASRMRIARQLLAESLMLGAAGTALGLLMARWGSALLVNQLATPTSVVFLDLSFDWRMIAFTAGVGLLTVVIFGVGPAIGATQVGAGEALKEQSRTIVADRRFGIRNALVVAQVALSLGLTVAAGLFVRSFVALQTFPLGFDAAPLLVVSVDARHTGVAPSGRAAQYLRLREAAAAVPGVANASAAVISPVSGSGWNSHVQVPGGPDLSLRQRTPWVNGVSPGWFATYGVRILAGRDFDSRDAPGGDATVIVDASSARKFFGDGDPVGREMFADIGGSDHKSLRVIGVVTDSVYRSARSGLQPTIFLPLAQVADSPRSISLTIRSSGVPPGALIRSVGDALARSEPSAAFTFTPIEAQIRASVAQERLLAMLSGFFAGLALLLAGLGLYGVTSYSVSRRRGEIGVRMALGADAGGVVRLVLTRVVWLVGIGITAGVVLSIWAVRFVGSLLYSLEPRDPATFVIAAAVLMAVGTVAGWLPARSAARTDPMRVLRDA